MVQIMSIKKKKHVLSFKIFLLMLTPPPPSAAQEAGSGTIPASSEPEVSKNMAIAFVALISGFFILGIISVYTRRCRERRFGRAAENGIGGGMTWRAARGLDPSFISTFPSFVYSTVKGVRMGESSLECAVCLNEFENSDTVRLIPKCSHVFHSVCIDAWLVLHSTCPVCRANLCPKPGELTLSILNSGLERARAEPSPSPSPSPQNHVSIPVVGEEVAAVANVMMTPSPMANRSTPTRSRLLGWRLSGIFQRSRSTGHDRFTLQLPEAVRSQLMSSTLNRTRSWAELPSERSLPRGYRSENGRWRNFLQRTLSVPSPFIGRAAGTGRSPVEAEVGERSFARLRPSGIGPSSAAV